MAEKGFAAGNTTYHGAYWFRIYGVTPNDLIFRAGGSTAPQDRDDPNQGIETMRITEAGNLGIGTSAPTAILHTVASGAKTAAYSGNLLTNTATSSTASITKSGLEITSTGTWNGTSASNIGLYVSSVTGGTNNYDAIFNGGGNVGIGTTSPTKKLDVAGTFSADSVNVNDAYTLPTADGTANQVLQTNGSGTVSWATVSAVGISPIGSVLAWLKSYPNTPVLPGGWVECNGQTLSDPDSPYNGQTIPDLNGNNRFLRGNSASGGTGGSTSTGNNSEAGRDRAGESDRWNACGTHTHEGNLPPYYNVVWIMRVH